MKKIINALLVTTLLSSTTLSVAMASFSTNTKSGSELSGESVLLSGPFSIVFVPVMASVIGTSVVADSLQFLGAIGDAISVHKVDRNEKTTVVYGTAIQTTTQKKVDVKFDIPTKVADKAQIKSGNDIKLQQTPMGTLVTYDNKSLGFAAGTENNTNMKSVPIR